MKVDGSYFSAISSVTSINRLKQLDAKRSLSTKDGVEVSNKANFYKTLLQSIKNIPDIRQERIDEITKEINNGQFKIDTAKIAKGIFNKEDF